MAEQSLDLWPEIAAADIRTPVSILRQQAALLGKHTNNLLEAKVVTQQWTGGFLHRFFIAMPIIGYQLELFTVFHDVMLYPVKINPVGDVNPAELESEKDLIAWLKGTLNSAETKRILTTLMAQAES